MLNGKTIQQKAPLFPEPKPLTKEQTIFLEKLICEKIELGERDLETIESCFMNDKDNGTDDTSPTFKSLEDGSNLTSRHENSVLAQRKRKHIADLKVALVNLRNNNYGTCRVTGNPIGFERLKLVPHATTSIEGKNALERQKLNR